MHISPMSVLISIFITEVQNTLLNEVLTSTSITRVHSQAHSSPSFLTNYYLPNPGAFSSVIFIEFINFHLNWSLLSRIFLGDFINFHFHNWSSFPSTFIVEFLDFHLHNHEIFSSMSFVNLLPIIGICSNFHVTLMFVPSYLFFNTLLHA